ncbi:MAG: SRPBCC family protein [Thermoplasmatota archaeon]
MQMALSTPIAATPTKVWNIITDIENATDRIQGILAIEMLEKPKTGVVGLKWKETRKFAGKEAHEIMWITEAKKPKFYVTRAENHGAIYTSRMDIEKTDDGCILTMGFHGETVTLGAKIMWALTGWMAKGPMRKAITQDLADIKAAAEA